MHDPVDIRRRIDRLFRRVDRRDDYGEFLARGFVVRPVEDVGDVEAWRAKIRRQARADKLQVRTGWNDTIVWALRLRRHGPEWEAESDRYGALLSRTVPLAAAMRHEPTLALRDGDEVVCACERCSALGYGHAVDDIVGGNLFEDECPNAEPPTLTPLAMMRAPSTLWPRDG